MNNLEELHKAQLELITAAYSQAKAYFNMVIVGGYAAFFALWAFVKDELSSGQTLWSALFISVSLVAFVSWEVLQMIASSNSLLGISRAVNDPQNFIRLIQEYQENEQKSAIRFRIAWIVQLCITVSTALIAAGILMYGFVIGLWRLYA